MKRPGRRRIILLAVAVVLFVLGWIWPPLPYTRICEPSIKSSVADAVPSSQAFKDFGYPGDRYAISRTRWLNAFRVKVDVAYSPGLKSGSGTTLVMQLTFAGWRVVGEKNGYIV